MVAAAIAAIAVVVDVWRGPDGGFSGPTGADSGVAHVHGLGINPRDGVLYAATHSGLFRVPEEGRAQRVADRYQDTMGFTVVGDDHFLGSGHPDINDFRLRKPGRPPLLGLIESRDAGESWEPLSLLGEADFHALVAAHGSVYGFDATNSRFMVSSDMRAWETRSTLQLGSFAVDPEDGDHVVATSAGGLVESRDGGRSWGTPTGPPVVIVSWDERAGLWGAGVDGSVHRRGEHGLWEEMGSVDGEPQAFLVQHSRLYAAAADHDGATSIYASTDGSSWELLYREGSP